MTTRYKITEAAERDLEDIARYIAQDSLKAAAQFFDRAEEAFNTLAAMPSIGTTYPLRRSSFKGVRRWPVKQFENYLIFYRPIAGEAPIEIIRVVHGARDLPTLFEEDETEE
jgi:toxin ParE1/3/4